MSENQTIRVVLYQDGDLWVAQGLELDICASGVDPATAKRQFTATCKLEAQARMEAFGDTRHGLEKAPQHFFDLWDRSEVRLERESDVGGCDVDPKLDSQPFTYHLDRRGSDRHLTSEMARTAGIEPTSGA